MLTVLGDILGREIIISRPAVKLTRRLSGKIILIFGISGLVLFIVLVMNLRRRKMEVKDSRIILWTSAPVGITFDGKEDFLELHSQDPSSLIADHPSLLKELSRQTISSRMLMGETYWWEKIDGKWIFRFTEHKDVYDEIFGSPNPVACIKIYVRYLSPEERQFLELYDKGRFTGLEAGTQSPTVPRN